MLYMQWLDICIALRSWDPEFSTKNPTANNPPLPRSYLSFPTQNDQQKTSLWLLESIIVFCGDIISCLKSCWYFFLVSNSFPCELCWVFVWASFVGDRFLTKKTSLVDPSHQSTQRKRTWLVGGFSPPIWKIWKSKWVHLPQVSGWK